MVRSSSPRGGTEYGVGWLPLGGYVKIAGMIDESLDTEQMKQPVRPDEFRAKPAWQRFLVMIAGIVMNILLAAIYCGICYTGAKIFRQRRRRSRLHLQHGGTGARLRERRQNHLDRRRADRRRERHRHDAAADRERPYGRRRARRPRRALSRSPSSSSSTSAARRATKRC